MSRTKINQKYLNTLYVFFLIIAVLTFILAKSKVYDQPSFIYIISLIVVGVVLFLWKAIGVKEYKVVSVLLVLSLIVLLWIITNVKEYFVHGIVGIIIILGIMVYLEWSSKEIKIRKDLMFTIAGAMNVLASIYLFSIQNPLGGLITLIIGGYLLYKYRIKGVKRKTEIGYITINLKETVIGAICGGIYVAIIFYVPSMAIGIPAVAISLPILFKWLIITFAAPGGEEPTSRGLVLDIIDKKLKAITGKDYISFHVANFIQAFGFFAVWHYVAYSSSLQAMGGSFISAGIFGLLMGYLRLYRKNNIWAGMVCHGIVNAFILGTLLVVVGV